MLHYVRLTLLCCAILWFHVAQCQQVIVHQGLTSTSFLDGSLFKVTILQTAQADGGVRWRAELYLNGKPVGLQEGISMQQSEVITGEDIQVTHTQLSAPFDQLLALGVLPEGQYQLCISAVGESASQCQSFYADARSNAYLLRLVHPIHRSTLDDPMPLFSWVGMLDGLTSTPSTYTMRLHEKPVGQRGDYYTAAATPPIFQKNWIPEPLLAYPADARPLETGKTYTWQVELFASGYLICRSEVWEFKLQPDPVLNDLPINRSYIDIGRINDQPSYHLAGALKLRYAPVKSTETIGVSVHDEDGRLLKGSEHNMTFRAASPYAEIDLTRITELKHLEVYTLVLTLPTGKQKRIKMTYVNPALIEPQN